MSGGEALQRVNFLLQASQALASTNAPLAQYLGDVSHNVKERVVMRIDHEARRLQCRKCHAPLQPGVTARVRLRSRREKHVNITCVRCQLTQRYLSRPSHVLKYETLPKLPAGSAAGRPRKGGNGLESAGPAPTPALADSDTADSREAQDGAAAKADKHETTV